MPEVIGPIEAVNSLIKKMKNEEGEEGEGKENFGSSDAEQTAIIIYVVFLIIMFVLFMVGLIVLFINWSKLSESNRIICLILILFLPILGPIVSFVIIHNDKSGGPMTLKTFKKRSLKRKLRSSKRF